jgi:hypothetical protein
MAADAAGNDVSAVGIPVTGFFGFAPVGTNPPTPAEGGSRSFVLPAAFRKLGLLKVDGGFEWTLEKDGDDLEFWQEGYTIPSGLANVTLAAGLAESNAIVRELHTGKTADANGYLTRDGSGHSTEYLFFSEEIFKNRWIRRRAAFGSLLSSAENKSTRGEVLGYDDVFKMRRDAAFNDEHIGEWWIAPPASSPAVITGATPADQGAGQFVDITGSGFFGTTQVKFGSSNAATFTVNSDGSIRAWLAPSAAGTANITVINDAGTSNAQSYTRVA